MKLLIKRIVSYIIVVTTFTALLCVPAKAETAMLGGITVDSTALVTDKASAQKNLFDANEKNIVLFDADEELNIAVKLERSANVSQVRIAVKNFPTWRKIKTVEIHSGDKIFKASVAEGLSGIQWVEINTELVEVSKFNIIARDFYDNEGLNSVGIAELEVYGEYAKNSDVQAGGARELEYNEDFTIVQSSADLGGWQWRLLRCFDKDSSTIGALQNLATGYIVYVFPYPTDVTKLKFRNQVNGDWATPKSLHCKVYNEDVVYRQKLTNPEPLWNGETYHLENTAEWQELELEGDIYKEVTHLMLQFTEGHISSTGATWGGWKEMEVHGLPHPEKTKTADIIATTLKSNTDILCDMGVVDGEPTAEFMNSTPTRFDMVKTILKLNGEYETAANYHGTFNFSDATPENYNLLSYIYAYKKFGIVGDGNNRFLPDEPLTAKACYKLILNLLGYECGKDFEWESMQSQLYSLGIGDLIYEETFNNRDMCNAICEAFTVPMKGTDRYYQDLLREKGIITESAWAKLSDKQDKVSPVLDGDYYMPDTTDRNGDFSFTYNEKEHILQPSAFCYNAPFHYAGLYYGTLPESNTKSKRAEFGEVMKKAGGRALRFPGGGPTHQYFIEGEEYGIQLSKKCQNFGMPDGGGYMWNDPNDNWYVDFWDFLDFCKEYDIEPVFQMNPEYYVDEQGEVRQAYLCHNIKKTDEGIFTSPELYDYNRIDEAIRAFEKNLDEMVERGYSIHYWEIGNEDNYANYSTLPLSDLSNPLTRDFIAATSGYVRAIKKRFPDAHIIVPNGFPYKEAMEPEVFAMLTSVTVHYPFGTWTIPPVDEKDSAARLARTNEQNFVRNYPKETMWEEREKGTLLRDNTETMAWRYEGWDPNSLMHTYANALNMGHNWGELVFDSGFIGINVLHDLESPWFGCVLYDVTLDPGKRYFTRNENLALWVHEEDVPDLYKFHETYYFNPASKAFEMLSRHCGGKVLANSRSNVSRYISGYASVKDGEVMFTIVNRFNETLPVNIQLPNISVSAQNVEVQILQSDYLRAVIEEEYNVIKTTMEICGNENDSALNVVEFEAMPQSITHFTIKADLISK